MRILQVNKFYDPRGGTERVLYDLEDGLRERGHEVAVFACAHPDNRPSPWSGFFLPERDYERTSGRVGPLGRARLAAATVYDREAATLLRRLLTEFEPDLVHMHNVYHQLSPSVIDVCREAAVPAVMTLHDYKIACPVYRLFRDGEICEKCVGTAWPLSVAVHVCSRSSRAESMVLAVESTLHRLRRTYERGIDAFVCPSGFMADVMRRHGLDPARLVQIANAPRHRPPAADPSERSGRPTVLFAGRISPEKGVDVLVEAARRVPEVDVRIAGDGPLAATLRQASTGLANIHWLGRLDSGQLDRERRGAWVTAVPSVWYENAPLSVIESFCAGRPVLAADHGGLVEMVEEGAVGWRIAPGDADAWAHAFARLPRAHSELMLMGTLARARADEDYDYGRFLSAHETLYERVLATRRVGSVRGATGP